jgi:putative ABC transport system permease protein
MRELIRFAIAHLRGSGPRTAAAMGAILVAVTSFVVLTGTVRGERLQVANNYRSTYDILVRPKGSAGPIEQADSVVRPNFLSGSYGGITLDQVKQISSVAGVAVAAPVAVLGQTMRTILVTVDVASVMKGRDRAMVRYELAGSVGQNPR